MRIHCAISLLVCGCCRLTKGLPSHPKQAIGEYIEETGFYQSIGITNKDPLLKKQSKYQLIEVHHSPHYGRILVLDGVVQLTEKDADAYNEMMAHMPMFQHKNPKRVLVIGGGDGYVLSEVLKHDSVEEVHHVDLDEEVIDTCKEYFTWGKAWDDPRVTLHVADGADFVRKAPMGSYDVVIQDSSDPWTWDENGNVIELPSSVLYSPEHFESIHRILKPDGILNLQAETIQIPSDLAGIAEWRKLVLEKGFESARYGTLMISSYPTGQIGFLMCQKRSPGEPEVSEALRKRYALMCESGRRTSYYHPRLQRSAFDLPLWAEQVIYGRLGLEGDNPESCAILTEAEDASSEK